RSIIPLADMEEEKLSYILEQIRHARLFDKYDFTLENASESLTLMKNSSFKLTTMGRSIDDDREFFLTLGAAGLTAAKIAKGEKINKLALV
ncbi:MAG: DUF3866 family protein, partial [Syntrophomonadaceae bacterium]|nr:DUF3866 family protein [Syntrophomonadaceae bacterium]